MLHYNNNAFNTNNASNNTIKRLLKKGDVVSILPRLLLLTLPWLLTACVSEGSDASSSVNQQSASPGTVLRSGVFSSSDNCPAGGVLIEIGIDTNGNDVLDDNEVQQEQELCNGRNGIAGASSLLELTAEPPGGNCTYGGTRIDSGLDQNDNSSLDPGEVAYTRYVCEQQACTWTDNGDGTSTVSCEGDDALVLLNPEALEFTARTTCVVNINNPDTSGSAIPMIYTIDDIGSDLTFVTLTILDGERQNSNSRLLTSTNPEYEFSVITLYFDNLEEATGGRYVSALSEVDNVVEFTYIDSDVTAPDNSFTQGFQAFDDASNSSEGLCTKVPVE